MLIKLKPLSEFDRNVLILMTGTIVSQAIPIAVSPILTRLYSPSDFGVLALFLAITNIFGGIANARYDLAIMLSKKEEHAINLFVLGLIVNLVLSLVLLLIVIFFHQQIVILLGNETIEFWLYFVPLTVFLLGLWNVLYYFNTRKKRYKDISQANITRSIAIAIVQLSVGLFKNGPTGLVTAQIVSLFLANTKLLKNITNCSIFISNISKTKIVVLAKRYKDFPKYSVPTALLDNLALQSPIFIISSLYSSSEMVGFYMFATRILQLPSSLISSSIAQVFYQNFSQLQNDKEAQLRLLFSTWKKLFFVGIVPFSLIFFLGEEIFSLAFGQSWTEAGKIASIVSPVIFVMFISSPTSTAFVVFGMQRIGFYFGIFVLISRPISIFLGYQLKSFYTGLLLMVISEIFAILVYNLLIVKKLRG